MGCLRVDVGEQAVAQLQVLGDDTFGFGTVAPGLSVAHIAVYAHQRQEGGALNPTEHTFDIVGIGVLVARTEETAGIVGPPGKSCADQAVTISAFG